LEKKPREEEKKKTQGQKFIKRKEKKKTMMADCKLRCRDSESFLWRFEGGKNWYKNLV